MTSIVYPYKKHSGEFQEIYHSIESVKKYFKADDFEIVVIGDDPAIDGVRHITHGDDDFRRTPWYDACLKMEAILSDESISKQFVIMHDDMYLLRPITDIADLRHFYYVSWPEPSRVYHHIMYQTKEAITDRSLNAWNCETHMPRVYNKNKMQVIWDEYSPKENALMYATLYFNHHHQHAKKTKLEKYSEHRGAFIGSKESIDIKFNLPGLKGLLDDTMVLVHNDKGLTDALKEYIRWRFPIFAHS